MPLGATSGFDRAVGDRIAASAINTANFAIGRLNQLRITSASPGPVVTIAVEARLRSLPVNAAESEIKSSRRSQESSKERRLGRRPDLPHFTFSDDTADAGSGGAVVAIEDESGRMLAMQKVMQDSPVLPAAC